MFLGIDFDLKGCLEAGLVFCAAFQLCAVVAVAMHQLDLLKARPAAGGWMLLAMYAGLGLLTSWAGQPPLAVLLHVAISASVLWAIRKVLHRFTLVGHLLLAAHVQMMVTGLVWGVHFLLQQPLPPVVLMVLGVALLLGLLVLPLNFGKLWLQAALFGRYHWVRPRTPCDTGPKHYTPKVSIHVPCYAEPPDVVIRTLNALAKLEYSHYEVIVIDNNTQDQALWRPLEAHCHTLGSRFRFIHVENLSGAKAGALNYILPQVVMDAELIAVVDSDYEVEPDFLQRLVGFFHDDQIGFVQTSHDYRSWKQGLYQKSCYWEYMPTYKHLLPTLNEWSAAFTVGTMCLIRRTALEAAGGWAEWCLTEDSELAIRIHALGYKSIVIADTFGRGLIPETFADYKKQRFRWTAGPAQQLKHHYRLLLSNLFEKKTAMSRTQKFFELIHCTEGVQFVLSLALWVLMPLILLLLMTSGNPIPLPAVFWMPVVSFGFSNILLSWVQYTMLGATLKDMLLAQLASLSLLHTREIASVTGFFSRKPLKWHRTNKFKALPSGLSALTSSRAEVVRSLVSFSMAGLVVLHTDTTLSSVLLLGTVTLTTMGVSYFTSLFMAMFSEWDLLRNVRPQQASYRLNPNAPVRVQDYA